MIRFLFSSLILCPAFYVTLIWGFAQKITPFQANGSLIYNQKGEVLGSQLIAQSFQSPNYFHPRPSACDYQADTAAASNLSPKSADFLNFAKTQVAIYQADASHPLPLDLATRSGSGLDPDISLAAAHFQVHRIAQHRQISPEFIEKLLIQHQKQSIFSSELTINVLNLNLALDQISH